MGGFHGRQIIPKQNCLLEKQPITGVTDVHSTDTGLSGEAPMSTWGECVLVGHVAALLTVPRLDGFSFWYVLSG